MLDRVAMNSFPEHPMAMTEGDSQTPAHTEPLLAVEPGTPILFGGDRVTRLPEEVAARFRAGDRILVVQSTGEVLHVPRREHEIAAAAVTRAREAFERLGAVSDDQITRFYEAF